MTWHFTERRGGKERKSEMTAYWHPNCEDISDYYTPGDISAVDLFHVWTEKVNGKHPDGLVPIDWSVRLSENGKIWDAETMPFQSGGVRKCFLTYFTWPTNEDGEQLNWLTLPVVDKHWNPNKADKGGFIQEATGWKPGILQPYLYLPSLIQDISTWPQPSASVII